MPVGPLFAFGSNEDTTVITLLSDAAYGGVEGLNPASSVRLSPIPPTSPLTVKGKFSTPPGANDPPEGIQVQPSAVAETVPGAGEGGGADTVPSAAGIPPSRTVVSGTETMSSLKTVTMKGVPNEVAGFGEILLF